MLRGFKFKQICFISRPLGENGDLQEWAIIELQGDLEARGNKAVNNQFIGDLSYNKHGQPVSTHIN